MRKGKPAAPRARPAKKPPLPKRPPKAKKAKARPTSGEQQAVKLALSVNAKKPAPEPVQLDLIDDILGLPETKALRDLRAKEPRIGRPAGAQNRRTVEWAEYLLTRYASPLEGLAQIANASVKELVASLGCTKLEALQEKRLAAIALAPYIHSKQPVSVDVTNRSVIRLTINMQRFEVGTGAGLTAKIIEGRTSNPATEGKSTDGTNP